MISVACAQDEVDGVCRHLRERGASVLRVAEPSRVRRVVLAAVGDGHSVAAAMRGEGLMAVVRPSGGAALSRWIDDTRPLLFGERLSVCPAWSEHDRDGLPGLVELGPGGFGNGRHPSTRQMIEELVDRIRGGERVLDVGSGSGILALCALRLGAAAAVAVDIDPQATDAARRNGVINGLDNRMEVTDGPLGGVYGSFDVVLANIARAGIVETASALVQRLAPHGWLAAGGLSPSQCSQVAGFLRPLVEAGRRVSGDWATAILTRNPSLP